MLRRNLAVAAALLVLATLTGCSESSGAAPADDAPTSTTSTAPDSASASPGRPTATPTAAATDEAYTCESILAPSTLKVFEDQASEGFALQDDFVERSRNYGGNLADFADFGGVLCQWAFPSGDGAVDYGYSPITDAQAATELATLMAGGYVEKSDKRGTLVVNSDTANFKDSYLFIDGFWFYGSDKSVLNLLVDNLPAP